MEQDISNWLWHSWQDVSFNLDKTPRVLTSSFIETAQHNMIHVNIIHGESGSDIIVGFHNVWWSRSVYWS